MALLLDRWSAGHASGMVAPDLAATIAAVEARQTHSLPSDVFDIFRRELDAAHAEGGLFELTMHPHVITYRSRIWIVEEIIKHAKALGDVWFATHADIVEWAKEHSE